MQTEKTGIPELSIVVPVINESVSVVQLLENLDRQTWRDFDVIFADGGSDDGTRESIERAAPGLSFQVSVVSAPRGRGSQMNAGAAASRGDILLFLHADSLFISPDALAESCSAFQRRSADTSGSIAGHFGLRFRRQHPETQSLAWYYYESKTRLNRADCIKGDQGVMVSRSFFRELGGFDASLPFLEDLRFSRTVAEKGTWILLPGELSTSARRLESRGLGSQQIMNAIIVNAEEIGWIEFFEQLPRIYPHHLLPGEDALARLLDGIGDLFSSMTPARRRDIWRSTGSHIASNAWQLFYWIDVRKGFRAGRAAGDFPARWLERSTRHLIHLFHSSAAALMATVLTYIWYRTLRIRNFIGTTRKN